ncbi:MAG: hypothetical protein V2A74_14555, partial [bacterium]
MKKTAEPSAETFEHAELTPQVKERRERLLQEGAKLLEAARTAVLRDSRNKSGLLVVRRFATA